MCFGMSLRNLCSTINPFSNAIFQWKCIQVWWLFIPGNASITKWESTEIFCLIFLIQEHFTSSDFIESFSLSISHLIFLSSPFSLYRNPFSFFPHWHSSFHWLDSIRLVAILKELNSEILFSNYKFLSDKNTVTFWNSSRIS